MTLNWEGLEANAKILRLKSTTARLKFKEIDRDQKRQWRMMINAKVHGKSYLLKIKKGF